MTRRSLLSLLPAAGIKAQPVKPPAIWHRIGAVENGVRLWSLGCDHPGDWSLWMHNLAFPEQVWPAICDTARDCRVRHDLTMQPGEVLPVRVVLMTGGVAIHEQTMEVRG